MKSNKRILFVLDWLAEEDWIYLARLRQRFETVTLFGWETPRCHDNNFEKLAKLWKSYLVQTIKVFKLRRRYDILLAWQPVIGLLFAFWARLLGSRTSIVIHNLIVPQRHGLNGFLRNSFIRFCLKKVELVTVSSAAETNAYRKRFANNRTRFHFIPFGIDVPHVSSMVDGDYLFSGGRSNRDYRTLFPAVDGLPVRVRVIAQKHNVANLAIPANVDINYSDFDTFDENRRNAQFVVVPRDRPGESSGQLVLLKAMAFGKAVIVTKNDGLADYVEHEKNAILVKPHQSDDLRRAILRLTADVEMRRRIGAQARHDVLEKFTTARSGALMAEAIESFV